MARKWTDAAVERMPWLDPPGEALRGATLDLVRSAGDIGQGIKDGLHGRWLGHALHPVLVTVPLGAWTTTQALDLAGMESGADLSLTLGIVGALGSALAGIADWTETDGTDRRLGLVHAALNTTGLALNIASLVLRRGGQRRGGVLLSVSAYALVNLSAYLGGELSYSKGVGVNHTAWEHGPADYTAAVALDELTEGKPLRVDVAGTPVMLVKQGEKIRALGATCPHAGGPLDQGELDGDRITCPWHGSVFCLADGKVLRGPAQIPLWLSKHGCSTGWLRCAKPEDSTGAAECSSAPHATTSPR